MRSQTLKLNKMLGEIIVARIPALDDNELSAVKLHSVEASGIWIESQRFTEKMMERFQTDSSSTTPVLFVPFEKVDFIVGSLTSLSLSEKAFGLTDPEPMDEEERK
jgi:hypothetical protein